MEELRNLLQLKSNNCGCDYTLESGDSAAGSDSDVSYESKQLLKVVEAVPLSNVAAAERKRNGEARLPTRRPDPNIYNRNALLARENRRKKKAHLETIEKELAESRNTNRALVKALKKQLKAARRLEQEKQYFKSLVANRTEILSLVSALSTRLSTTRPLSPPPSASLSLNYSTAYATPGRSSSLGGSYYDPDEPLAIHFDHSPTTSAASTINGSVKEPEAAPYVDAPFFPSSPMDSNKFLDNFFTDYDGPPTTMSAFDDTWHELLQEDEFINLQQNLVHPPNNISAEHSYVTSVEKNAADNAVENENAPGVCLHITRGRVSLEFCPSCHWNAAATSRTPPTQLLHEED